MVELRWTLGMETSPGLPDLTFKTSFCNPNTSQSGGMINVLRYPVTAFLAEL